MLFRPGCVKELAIAVLGEAFFILHVCNVARELQTNSSALSKLGRPKAPRLLSSYM